MSRTFFLGFKFQETLPIDGIWTGSVRQQKVEPSWDCKNSRGKSHPARGGNSQSCPKYGPGMESWYMLKKEVADPCGIGHFGFVYSFLRLLFDKADSPVPNQNSTHKNQNVDCDRP